MSRVLLPVKEGDTWNIAIQCRDSLGAAYNLTGFTAHMQIRTAPKGTVLVELGSAGGDIEMNSPDPGDLLVIVDSDTTEGLTLNNHNRTLYADVELRDAATPPLVITVAALEFDVEPDSTIRV